MGHGYFSEFCRMLELVVVANTSDLIPTIWYEYLNDVTGRIAFHLTTSLNYSYYNTYKSTCQQSFLKFIHRLSASLSGSYSIMYFPGESSIIVNFKPMILQIAANSCAEKLSRRNLFPRFCLFVPRASANWICVIPISFSRCRIADDADIDTTPYFRCVDYTKIA